MNDFQEVKRRVDLISLIEKRTGQGAKRSGKSYLLPECPFCKGHGCFSINREDQVYNCFQCPGERTGGDVFTFLCRLKGYDNRSALEELARDAGYPLNSSPSAKRDVREAVLRWARKDWSRPDASAAWAYLTRERRLSEEVLRSHDVGYLADRAGMISALKKEGFSYDEIKSSGILTQGYFDFYQILFGWRGVNGTLSGFVAGATRERLCAAKESGRPKYKTAFGFQADSPYNLHDAKRRVHADGAVIIVEGILDCLQLNSVGISNAVSLGGTAFKEAFGRALESTRFHRIIFMPDSDPPGRSAANRAVRHLLTHHPRFSLYVAEICAHDPKEGKPIKDPDELIVKLGAQAARKLIEEPIRAGSWLILSMRRDADLTNDLKRDEALRDVAALWDKFTDEIEKKEVLRYLAEFCALPQEDIRKTIERYAGRKGESLDRKDAAPGGTHEIEKAVAKAEEAQKKYQALKEKSLRLSQENRALLRAYARCVAQIRELSRAGLLWHVNRLMEVHAALLKQIRKDPSKSAALLGRIDEIFGRSSIRDLERINAEVAELCGPDGKESEGQDA